MFENLDRNWSTDPEEAVWEQACFASFCVVFCNKHHRLPPPNFCVVDGLWSQVVLPSLLEPKDDNEEDDKDEEEEAQQNHNDKKKKKKMTKKTSSSRLPQLVSQDVWTKLRKLGFLQIRTTTTTSHNNNNNNNNGSTTTTTTSWKPLSSSSLYSNKTTVLPDTVHVTHSMYAEYGHVLWEQRFPHNRDWTIRFGRYLQSALFAQGSTQPQLEHVQLYASHVLVPYGLLLLLSPKGNNSNNEQQEQQRDWVASLLHQPTFGTREWSLMHKLGGENALQITLRHLSFVQLYLSTLPPSSTKWQETLGLYQGWHTLLQQEMELGGHHASSSSSLPTTTPTSSPHNNSSSSSSSSNNNNLDDDMMFDTSSHGSRRSRGSNGSCRKKRRPHPNNNRRRSNSTGATAGGPKPTKSPLGLLVLGRSLYTLSMSLDAVLTELPGNPAMNVLWKRQAAYLYESLVTLSQVSNHYLQQQQHNHHHGADHCPCPGSVGHVSKRLYIMSQLLSAASWLGLAQCCATLEESHMMDHVVDLDDLASLFQLQSITDRYDNDNNNNNNNNNNNSVDNRDSGDAAGGGTNDTDDNDEEVLLLLGSGELRCLKIAKELLKTVAGARKQQHQQQQQQQQSPTVQLVYESLMAEMSDGMGRWLYDRGHYRQSWKPLEKATELKRQVISLLRDVAAHPEPKDANAKEEEEEEKSFWPKWGSFGASSPPAPSSVAGPSLPLGDHYIYYFVPSRTKVPKTGGAVVVEDVDYLCQQLCLHPPKVELQIQEMELSLSQSLEYAALAMHATDLSTASLSWMQEALILKTTHLGKMSLEVARVNAAMAVVHEDLLQWEAALTRYRECLRIRMHCLSHHPPQDWFSPAHEDLFRAILETLRSMGNAYRLVGNHDNAVGCFWKIATLSRQEWEIQRDHGETTFWGFNGHRRMADELRKTPLPTLVLEEERYLTTQRKSQRYPLEIIFQRPPRDSKQQQQQEETQGTERENIVLVEAAQAYQTVLSLFKDKAAASDKKDTNCTGMKDTLANAVDYEDLPVLLAASYHLGLIHMHVRDYRSAISSLEHSLHCLWILDPSSSSGSDSSDGASSDEEGTISKAKRNRSLRGIFGKELEPVEDEGVYHALGICRAACLEHDQAVRFHLTALRCARRIYGVNSIRASEILYDAAVSYWYLKEYEKASEFWSTCKQIRQLQRQKDDDSEVIESSDFAGLVAADLEYARVLYTTGASLCAIGRFADQATLTSLEEAKEIFAEQYPGEARVEIANCLFYMAVTFYRRTQSSPDAPLIRSASACLNKATSIYRSLGYLTSHSSDGQEDSANLALQAHVRYVEAMMAESQGKLHLAIDTYCVALHYYRILGSVWNVYIASVLYRLGRLQVRLNQDAAALVSLSEAWKLQRESLGREHEATGQTLVLQAGVHARMEKHETALEMFTEGLRIQINKEGSDSSAVASTLLKLSSVYFRQGNVVAAKERLQGALSIRRGRVDRFGRASRVVSFWSGDLADDYLFLMKNNKEDRVGGDHVRKVLLDDMMKEEAALAVVLHCMGNVNVKMGDLDQAKASYEQSLQVRRRHPVSAAMSLEGEIDLHACDTLHNLGCLYELCGDYVNALKYFATALKLKHRLLVEKEPKGDEQGNDPASKQEIVLYSGKVTVDSRYLRSSATPSYALTLHRIGSVHQRMSNSDIAVPCFETALRIQKSTLGNHHFRVAQTLADLAATYRTMEGKGQEALRCYREAFGIRQHRGGRNGIEVGHLLYRMGTLYDKSSDYKRAATCYRQAIRVYGRRYVDAVGRRFCQGLLVRMRRMSNSKAQTVPEEENESHVYTRSGDILGTDGLGSVESIEATERSAPVELTTLASAWMQATNKSDGLSDSSIMMDMDVHAPDCWISLELYLLSLFELFNFVATEWHKHASVTFQQALQQLEQQQSGDGMVKQQDPVTFRMLYLIQE